MTEKHSRAYITKPLFLTAAALAAVLLVAGIAYYKKVSTPPKTTSGPSAAGMHYETGMKLAQNGDLTGAANEWQTAIALEPAYAPPYLALVKKFEMAGDYASAVKQLDVLRHTIPETAHIECRQAGLYMKANRYETALKTAREAVKRESDCAQAHVTLGALLGRAGDWTQAIQELQTAHRAAPEEPAITLALAVALGRGGKAEEGIALLEGLPESARQSPPALYRLAWLLAEYGRNGQKDDPAALKALEQALAKAPDDPDSNALAGTIWLRAGDLEQAGSHFNRALQGDPNNARAARGMATVMTRQKHHQAAKGRMIAETLEKREAALQQARGRYLSQPEDSHTLLTLAELEAQTGNRLDALDLIKQALQKDPNDAAALELLHRLTRSLGK